MTANIRKRTDAHAWAVQRRYAGEDRSLHGNDAITARVDGLTMGPIATFGDGWAAAFGAPAIAALTADVTALLAVIEALPMCADCGVQRAKRAYERTPGYGKVICDVCHPGSYHAEDLPYAAALRALENHDAATEDK